MKRLGIVLAICLSAGLASAQAPATAVKFPGPDASPADILYFPVNAAKVKDVITPIIKVIYSRPQKKGREIFGVMEKFGSVWRMGANESTDIQFTQPVTIGGKKLKAGSYSLFAIPNEKEWTIIVNEQTNRWGLSYDQTKDVVRVNVPVETTDKVIEYFSMTFVETPTGANLVMAWDRTQVQLPILFTRK